MSVVLIFALLGFLAIRFNFWPPNCNILPIKEAKRVCEFSKLDKVPKGKAAKITFWVTIPDNTPAADKVFLAIEGKELIEMEKINNTSFQKLVNATTGETLKYRYLRNDEKSSSDEKELKVKSFEKKVYDFVAGWSDLSAALALNKNMIGAIDMKDTWTINYNMNLFEDTRRNLDSSMERVKAMGGKEFGVYSFIDMAGDKENFTVTETASPYYHWRDATITESEMKTIVKKAKAHGLKTVLHYNIGADYNKYLPSLNPLNVLNPVPNGQGQGTGGNAAEQKAGADFGRDEPKTKEWLDRYFDQLEPIILKWGASAERAGIDAIDITPQYRPAPVAPLYDYADTRFSQIITNLRKVYHGEIYGSNFSAYGGMRYSPLPKYINDLDRLIIYVARINVRPNASVAEMRQAHAVWLDELEQTLADYNQPIFLVMAEASFDGTTSGKPVREWGDFAEALSAGYEEDWQEQADSFEAFFQALNGRTKFAGVITHFWWDDLMAPKYVSTLNNMESTIRNKPAEAVWKKWMLPLQQK